MKKVNKNELIKVLWIDDQNLQTFIDYAYEEGIDISRKPSWNSGKSYLNANYDIIDAVILDCYCPLEDNGPEDYHFLNYATSEINRLSGERKRQIPWYVLSKGGRDDFNMIIDLSIDKRRDVMSDSWGKKCYVKGNDEDEDLLLKNIKTSVENCSNFWVRSTYSDVFKSADALGLGQTNELQQILKALHFPEEMPGFDSNLYYNRLRIIVEYFFRACIKNGLIPENVAFDPDGNLSVKECSLFFSGKWTRHTQATLPNGVTYPENVASLLWNIIKNGNVNSHSQNDYDRYVVNNVGVRYSLYGFSLQLCDAICWLYKYISDVYPRIDLQNNMAVVSNPNTISQNILNKYKKEYLDKKWLVQKTDGVFHCGRCCLGTRKELGLILGKEIRLQEVHFTMPNTTDIDKYPISSNYRICNSDVDCCDFDNLYMDQDGCDIHNKRIQEIINVICTYAASKGGMIRIGINEHGTTGISDEMRVVDKTFFDLEKEIKSMLKENDVQNPSGFLIFPKNSEEYFTIYVLPVRN